MNKSRKIYIKALNKYNNGYIDRAIELCEESISIDIKNAAAVNLKGLLYYLKGDLDSAQKLWKMNKQINKDEISEKYLEDTEKDKERLKFYVAALEFMREEKLEEAINLLEKCLESHYNYINVNEQLSLCYFNKGLYNAALQHAQKVLTIDRTNALAKTTIRRLKSLGVTERKFASRKVVYILIIIMCLLTLVIVSTVFIKFTKGSYGLGLKSLLEFRWKDFNKSDSKEINSIADKTIGEIKKNTGKIQTKEENTNKRQDEVFPYDKIKSDIENNNFDAVYDDIINWRGKAITDKDKTLLSSANEMLKTIGVEYFYNRGYSYMNNQDYNNAKVYLLKAYKLGGRHYLYPHIIYALGTSFHLSGDAESTIKYYTQYDKSFPSGEYEETVLYTLAIIFKDKDLVTSKYYAGRLTDNFPDSTYNNSIIKSLLY